MDLRVTVGQACQGSVDLHGLCGLYATEEKCVISQETTTAAS